MAKSTFFLTALLSVLPNRITLIAAQTTNIALNKPASMSSQYSGSVASRGNDGNTDGNHDNGSVFHTQWANGEWWQVELSDPLDPSEVCSVDHVTVWNRDTFGYRTAGVEIELWNGDPDDPASSLVTTGGPLVDTMTQTINFGTTGVRYVRLTRAVGENMHLAEVQVFGSCGAPSVGAGGDPHIKLFSGEQHDFHGHCDLLLIESPSVADGAGLSIQVRSSPYKEIFSYISEAAIQIGGRVLTIGSGGKHAIDGVPQILGETGSLVVDDLHQHPVQSSATWKGRRVYKIHLGDGPHGKEEIVIREFKNWITVSIIHASAANLEKSKGLLGRFPDGALLGKDGKTIHTSYDDFGQDWQVPPGDSLLGPGPFLDSSCAPLQALKDIRLRGRRLGESSITRAQAMEACKHWRSQMENCITDVQVSGDLEMANAGPL